MRNLRTYLAERPWLYGHLALVVQLLVVSPAYTLSRFAALEIETKALLQVRLLGASALLLPVFFALGGFRRFRLTRGQWVQVSILGCVGILGNQFMFMYGLKYTTPANSSLLYALTPLVVLLLSAWMLRTEQMTWVKAFGILLAVAGVWVVFLGKDTGLAINRGLGNAVTLGAVGCWSLYIALSKRTVKGLHPIQLTVAVMVVSALAFLPVGVPAVAAFDWQAVPRLAWVGLGSLILLNSLANYLLVGYAVSVLRASQAAVYINLHPIGAAIFSYFFLGERFTAAFVIGAGLTLAGLYTLNFAQAALNRYRRSPMAIEQQKEQSRLAVDQPAAPAAPAAAPATPSER